MGRNITDSPSNFALEAATSEDHAALSAAHALISENNAKDYSDAALAYVNQAQALVINTATVYIYQRGLSSTIPDLPTANSLYHISSGDLDNVNNGWSKNFPSSGGDYLFVTYATVTTPLGTIITTIDAGDWQDAQLMAQSGSGGGAGETTTAYWMTRSAGIIQKSVAEVYLPGVITFSAHSITGTEAAQNYATKFVIATTLDGTTFVDTYVSSANEYSVSYTIPPNIKAIRVRMYQAGNLSFRLHEELIPVVIDGISYIITVESTNGDIFRVGQSTSTNLIAHVFKNGIDVTNSIPASNFKWRRFSYYPRPYPNDDTTWNLGYASGFKWITINVDSVDSRATFHCDIIKDD